MNKYKVGDLVHLNESIIIAGKGWPTRILNRSMKLRVDKVDDDGVTVHIDGGDCDAQFALSIALVRPHVAEDCQCS